MTYEIGQTITITTVQGRILTGTVIGLHAGVEVITSKGSVTEPTLVEVQWADGDVTAERPEDLR